MKTTATADLISTGDVVTSIADARTRHDMSLVSHVEVTLAAQVGTLTLSVEKLYEMKSGDVVALNEALEAPVTLMLNGRAVARAELVAIDDHFGVRILELA